MADTLTAAEAEKEFWKSLKESNTGLLGLDQPGYHAQPMTAFREAETGTIWFFTRDDTDLARDAGIGGGQSAMFHYWNPVLGAWYPDGKDDPHLTILRFDADDGRVWVSKGGLIKFAFEIAKANITKTLPDAGGVADVNLQ